MQFQFKIIPAQSIAIVVPLVKKMSKPLITEALLLERFKEMVTQNYEYIGVYDADELVGVSGLWFCTRHYSGRSVELDHVFIDDTYRNKGLGTVSPTCKEENTYCCNKSEKIRIKKNVGKC